MTALLELIVKLEAATEGSRELDGDIAEVVQPTSLQKMQAAHLNTLKRREDKKSYMPVDRGEWCRDSPTHASWKAPHYTTSIDAAEKLVPVRLGYMWDLACYGTEGAAYFGPRDVIVRQFTVAATPALALCIAALKARSDQ